jgi:hypothetical protein
MRCWFLAKRALYPLFKVTNNSKDVKIVQSYYDVFEKIQKLDDVLFFNNQEIKNRYSLLNILHRGNWTGGTVDGYWHERLEFDENPLFHYVSDEWFYTCWKIFHENAGVTNGGEKLIESLRERLSGFYQSDIENISEIIRAGNIKELNSRQTIHLWLLLEFLYNKTYIFKYDKNKAVSYIYGYPNLIKVNDKENLDNNDYRLGNILLGWSYYNNKYGWVFYAGFPLMEELDKKREEISDQDIENNTKLFKSLLEKEGISQGL